MSNQNIETIIQELNLNCLREMIQREISQERLNSKLENKQQEFFEDINHYTEQNEKRNKSFIIESQRDRQYMMETRSPNFAMQNQSSNQINYTHESNQRPQNTYREMNKFQIQSSRNTHRGERLGKYPTAEEYSSQQYLLENENGRTIGEVSHHQRYRQSSQEEDKQKIGYQQKLRHERQTSQPDERMKQKPQFDYQYRTEDQRDNQFHRNRGKRNQDNNLQLKNACSFNKESTPKQVSNANNPFSGQKDSLSQIGGISAIRQTHNGMSGIQETSISGYNENGISFLNLLDRSTQQDQRSQAFIEDQQHQPMLFNQLSSAQQLTYNQPLPPQNTFHHQVEQQKFNGTPTRGVNLYSNFFTSQNQYPSFNNSILHNNNNGQFNQYNNQTINNSQIKNKQNYHSLLSQSNFQDFSQQQQSQNVNTFQTMNPASPDIGLSVDESITPTSSINILKQELYQSKKQLVDAQNSYDFMKKEKLRIEHEKNLLDIQVKQLEEIHNNRAIESDQSIKRIKELEVQLEEFQKQNSEMSRQIKNKDHQYKDKLIKINKDLEQIDKRKHRSKEKLYSIFMQMKVSAQNVQQICEFELKNHQLTEFLKDIEERCSLMEHLLIQNLHPQRDETLQVKAYRRKHNFEKFRKETQDLINKYFHNITQSNQTQNSLLQQDLEKERLRNKDLHQRLVDNKEQVNTLQDKLRQLQSQLNKVIEKYSKQKDNMMTLNQNEIKMLIQENEMLKKRERQQDEELQYYKEQFKRLKEKYNTITETAYKRGRSQQSSAKDTKQIIFNNKEFIRVVEDKTILERQVDEYKSTVLNQTQLIKNLQHIIQKQQLKIDEQKLNYHLNDTLSQSMKNSIYITTEDELKDKDTQEDYLYQKDRKGLIKTPVNDKNQECGYRYEQPRVKQNLNQSYACCSGNKNDYSQNHNQKLNKSYETHQQNYKKSSSFYDKENSDPSTHIPSTKIRQIGLKNIIAEKYKNLENKGIEDYERSHSNKYSSSKQQQNHQTQFDSFQKQQIQHLNFRGLSQNFNESCEPNELSYGSAGGYKNGRHGNSRLIQEINQIQGEIQEIQHTLEHA
ncbi:UNKNOWN [Stylonychia lemnae]|uniref:Uncharacterized protein n=1 Tax=Stylonychia lemnae TaxID=5949 RepID=A0A078ABY7_STYLE|nr:UNKNOWN [Stylonychia lemnae]|eukprot:CDW79107.1 UNKNOWN [Stylonychia lemnae]